MGADAYLYGVARIGDGDTDVIVRTSGRDHLQMGDTIHVTADADGIHLFDKVLARGSTNGQAARQRLVTAPRRTSRPTRPRVPECSSECLP